MLAGCDGTPQCGGSAAGGYKLLEAQDFSVHTERDFPPLNVMMYAQKSEKSMAA